MTVTESNAPCTSTQDAIERLRYTLDLHGGSVDGDDEPGLPADPRITENALRQVIRYLQTLA